MNPARAVRALALASLITGCAGETRHDVVIGSARTEEIAVPAGARVRLSLPPGEAVIEGTESNELKAEMVIRCGAATGACAERAAKMIWLADSSDDGVQLRVSPEAMFDYRNAETTTHVWVPADRPLSVSMSAGDLTIRRVSGCLDVQMKAGDVNVEVPEASVRTAHLEATFGDASLTTSSGTIEEHRHLVVGAQVSWEEGKGECPLSVHLSFGDASGRLY